MYLYFYTTVLQKPVALVESGLQINVGNSKELCPKCGVNGFLKVSQRGPEFCSHPVGGAVAAQKITVLIL